MAWRGYWAAIAAVVFLAGCAPIESEVDFVSPAPNAVTAASTFTIEVGFDHTMNIESITNSTFFVTGSQSGTHTGVFNFLDNNSRVEFVSAVAFIEGETITVRLSDGIRSLSDKKLDPYSWTFQVAPAVVVELDPLLITSLNPSIETNAGATTGTISVRLSAVYDPSTILPGVVVVEGSRSGQRDVTFDALSVLPGLNVVFTVDRPFLAGERVTIAVTTDLHGFAGEIALPSTVQYLARNNGTLWPLATHSSGTGLVGGHVCFFDVDADGLEEWATIAADGTVTVQDVDATGLTAVSTWNLGEPVAGAAVGDFDADGRSDLAVLAAAGDVVFLFTGSPSIALILDPPVSITLDRPATGLVAGHLDPDGVIDLVTYDAAGVAVAWGGASNPLVTQVTLPAVSPIAAPALGDFDGDGLPDLAVAVTSGEIDILIGQENRGFAPAVTLIPTHPATGVVAVSLDGDDMIDLVATAAVGTMGTAFLPVGAMDFDSITLFADAAGTGSISADWDGDGNADLVCPVAGSTDVRISLGDGTGNLLVPTVETANGNVTRVNLGDTNGDGVLDLALVFADGAYEVALGDAANPPLVDRVRLEDIAAVTAGDTGVPFTVLADAERDIEAYTVVLAFDPALVQVTLFEVDGTDAGALSPDFSAPNIDNVAGSAILGVIFDFLPGATPSLLPIGTGHSIAAGTLSINAAAPTGVTQLTPTDGLGTPANDNVFVNGGLSYSPELVGTSISITGVVTPPPVDADFIRGDANFDGTVNLADGSFLQDYVAGTGGPAPACFDAADVNDDGILNIADVIDLYDFLFSGGTAPNSPFPLAGSDPTTDSLDCTP